jgi:hypothetical protein
VKALAQKVLDEKLPIDDFIEFWLSKDIEIIKEQP